MIKATETQVQNDTFDFLRITDDDIKLNGPDEIGSGAIGLHGIDPLDSVIQSETEIKEKA